MTNVKKLPIVFLSFFLLLTSCTPEKKKLLSDTSGEVVKDVPGPVVPPTPEVPPVVIPPPTEDKQLNLCSKLDLEGVVWPSDLSVAEWSYYALGLNITGSFEGNSGWKNITGNFDGQGMSLGLMQQNFGQGSLQPWLIEMYKQYNGTMVTNFSSANYKSLKTMLEGWQNSPITASALEQADLASEELFPHGEAANKLDIGFDDSRVEEQAGAGNSVSWAKSNILDSSGNVKAPWKKSFQDMAVSSGYRSFQLAASTKIFFKAKQYFQFFNFHELRYLLFLFDIVVQNGSIQDSHLAKYNKWLASNPHADEKARALALLEARLSTVRPQYVADVRSRKTAIINGTGTVHGTNRNFGTEFCFDPRVMVQ